MGDGVPDSARGGTSAMARARCSVLDIGKEVREMAASRRVYVATAETIRVGIESSKGEARQAYEDMACCMAMIFGTDNPNFDSDRFMKACGM